MFRIRIEPLALVGAVLLLIGSTGGAAVIAAAGEFDLNTLSILAGGVVTSIAPNLYEAAGDTGIVSLIASAGVATGVVAVADETAVSAPNALLLLSGGLFAMFGVRRRVA